MNRPRAPRRLATLLGFLVSILFIFAAARHLDARAVVGVWRSAHLLPWLPLGAAFYTAGHFVRGRRLQFLVRRETTLPLVTASNVVVVGYASNNVLPARLGELVRAGMLAERTGIPLSQTITVTLIERLLDGVAILSLFVVSTLISPTAGWIVQLARVAAIVFGIAFLGLFAAVALPRVLLTVSARVVQPLGPKWRDRLLGVLTNIVGATSSLRQPQDAAVIGVLSLLVWVLEAAMFLCVLPSVGLEAGAPSAMAAMSVTNLGILVPSTPGYVGPFHFFCAQTIMAHGAPEAVALGYAILVHLTFYVPATLWGAGAMLWYGVQVGATAALARAARNAPGTKLVTGVPVHVIAQLERDRKDPEPDEFHVALAEALLPTDARLDAKVTRGVATFLVGEIEALPPRVRVLYQLGMTMFRFWVRLRNFGRSFCGLSLEERRAAVSSFAFGRIPLLRQLFRAPRSAVLLAFYDRPVSSG